MNIRIQRLSLRNFKGIRELDIEFSDEITTISGRNATGKTTIVDAFRWLLFGKDSSNAANFTIKTTGPDGEPIHGLEHEVEADLIIDHVRTTLRKVYKEDWRTRRGEAVPYLAGHTNSYFWNGVPLSEKDYKKSVDELIEENLFKLITDPMYFNSDALKWQQRRDLLIKMAGGITDADVVATNGDFAELIAMLSGKKTLDGLKAEIAVKKKKIKDELILIPARIDELNRSKPEPQDWADLRLMIIQYEEKLKGIDAMILDRSKKLKSWQDGKVKLQQAVINAQDSVANIRIKITNEVKASERERKSEIENHEQNIANVQRRITGLDNQIQAIEKQLANAKDERKRLLSEFSQQKDRQIAIDENEFVCPTCKRELDPLDIETKRETMIRNFSENRAKELQKINDRGKLAKAAIDRLEGELEYLKKQRIELDNSQQEAEEHLIELRELEKDRPSLESIINIKLNASVEYKDAELKLQTAEKELNEYQELKESEDTTKQQQGEKAMIYDKIRHVQQELDKEGQIKKINERIKELEAQEQAMANELASLERVEFLILEFSKAKVALIDQKINGLFNLVTFRMFKKNLNGGEEPCCDTLINGVLWHDCNHAGKINAGLDIIRALNEYYDTSAPVFTDNAEAVNKLNLIGTQMIRLVVTEEPTLTIQGEPVKAAAIA